MAPPLFIYSKIRTYPPDHVHIVEQQTIGVCCTMQTNWNENRITLHGRVGAVPEASHVNHGETYYIFPLVTCRLSGAEDRLNIIAPERLLLASPLKEGDEISVWGEVRSFNNKSGIGSRLVITVFAREMRREQAEDENTLLLTGTLCKQPIYRRTPLGRDICDMMLAVNRRYGRTDYLPCIAWGTLARRCGELGVGDALEVDGRLQSRVYTKRLQDENQQRTAFEISVMSMEVLPPRSREEAPAEVGAEESPT